MFALRVFCPAVVRSVTCSHFPTDVLGSLRANRSKQLRTKQPASKPTGQQDPARPLCGSGVCLSCSLCLGCSFVLRVSWLFRECLTDSLFPVFGSRRTKLPSSLGISSLPAPASPSVVSLFVRLAGVAGGVGVSAVCLSFVCSGFVNVSLAIPLPFVGV